MKCINCSNEDTMVMNTRPTKSDTQVWRRRRCENCKTVFTTHEVVDLSHIIVIKRSGKAVRYFRAKLFAGIYGATIGVQIENREVLIEKVTSEVELAIINLKKQRIHSETIGAFVLESLLKHSIPTFLRFIARHKHIETESQLYRELERFMKK